MKHTSAGNTPALETDRLILRRFREGEEEALFSILGDPEVNTFLPMFPLGSLEEAKNYLNHFFLDFYQKPQGYRYAVCLKNHPAPVGYVLVSEEESRDLGYGLKKEFWNLGITTEACLAVIEQLRADGCPYITATHDVNNPGSGEVMKKIGMTYQYTYEELWQPKNFLVHFRMYQLNLDGEQGRVFRKYWDQYPVHFVEENL